ncbi:unnamed protein product [Caenorhabditis auriculariae]|uniref:Centromere/kinetochore protein zw10 homolog n=1 Tax=Caenorhabditis auriculariae TaxID=2777116 RepID=A0A8S1HCN7_9PELO|nr:unnamed protein product [Caenorhabditis auriculariae]
MSNLDAECTTLENELTRSLTAVTNDFADKYEKMLPFINVASQGKTVMEKLERVQENAFKKLDTISEGIRQVEAENVAMNLSMIEDKKRSCQRTLEFIELLREIEEHLVTLRSVKNAPKDIAQTLVVCKEKLQEVSRLKEEAAKEGFNVNSPVKYLAAEYAHQNFEHRYYFSTFYENFVWFPKNSASEKDSAMQNVLTLTINNENPDITAQYLTAMNMIGQLTGRLKDWKNTIIDVFCNSVISSRDGVDILDITQCGNTYTFKARLPKTTVEKSMDVHKVLGALENFFDKLATALENVDMHDATGQKFITLIGSVCREQLIEKILKECIAIAAPVSTTGDKDHQHFLDLVERGEEFVTFLKKLEFLPPDASLLYNLDKDVVFIDRRCFAIVSRAKELITDAYTELVTVGCDGETSDSFNAIGETLESVKGARTEQEQLLSEILRNKKETLFPSIFRFMKCTVSKSTVDLADLITETMTAAAEAKDNDILQGRLTLTGRNVLQLFLILSPRHHGHMFNTIPHMAAVFYNNCHYLMHRMMTLSVEVRKIGDPSGVKMICEPILSDVVPRLREVAAECMESTLTRCKRDIATLIDTPNAFEYLPKGYILSSFPVTPSNSRTDNSEETPELVRSLSACILHISSIAKVFKEVLTELVYCKSIASLISFILRSLTTRMTSKCDIRENDGRALVTIFGQLLVECDKLLFYRGRSRVPEFCDREYFRLQEVIYCLGGSLRDIEMRWCNGKGPLAEWLSHEEVHRMIVAMFADSQLRQDVLNNI